MPEHAFVGDGGVGAKGEAAENRSVFEGEELQVKVGDIKARRKGRRAWRVPRGTRPAREKSESCAQLRLPRANTGGEPVRLAGGGGYQLVGEDGPGEACCR